MYPLYRVSQIINRVPSSSTPVYYFENFEGLLFLSHTYEYDFFSKYRHNFQKTVMAQFLKNCHFRVSNLDFDKLTLSIDCPWAFFLCLELYIIQKFWCPVIMYKLIISSSIILLPLYSKKRKNCDRFCSAFIFFILCKVTKILLAVSPGWMAINILWKRKLLA